MHTSLLRIRASAGSGKTYALTGHFLRLLAGARAESVSAGRACATAAGQGHAWPDILAVTFTNRAAAEMKTRIIRRLKIMALGQEEGPPPWTGELAQAWLERILRHYGALNVRTIDSLLHLLVRLAALELGLPPDFEPVFADAEALAPLLDDLLEEARRDPALWAELERACGIMLAHTPHRGFMAGGVLRERVLDLVLVVSEADAVGLSPPEAVAARLEMLCAALREAAKALQQCAHGENLALSRNTEAALLRCLGDQAADLPPDSVMLRKDDLDECLLKNSRGKASSEAHAAYARLREAVDRLDEQAALLRGALRIVPFVRLARRMAEALPDHLQSQSQLPASLTPGLARRMLESGCGVPEAFCRMGASLTHLLIDEFQDTSREQWAALHPLALEALSRGGSLTWVGDVKQAIYGWRGGDAALFGEIAQDAALADVAGASRTDTLPVNRRSRSAVVRANNSVFSRLGREETARTALAAMLPDATPESVLEEAARRVAEGFADAAQLESGKEDGFVRLERLEAANQAALRLTALNRLSAIVLEVAARRPRGDITVLVRSNRQAMAVAEHLLGLALPVVTENSLLLAEHPLIAQCVDFLRWLHADHDATAFWSVLAGPRLLLPLARLGRERLEDWLVTRDRALPLTEAFRRDFPEEWKAWLEPFANRGELISPYDAVREMLGRWRVWERLPDDAPFVRRFLEIIHSTEQEGQASLGAFLAYWDARGAEEKAPMPEAVDAIRVMTMHKAKGLQFPVVIVPWNDFVPRAGTAPVAVELDDLRLLTPQRPETGATYYAALAAAAGEMLNLLYVAWTRAEDELYAFLHAGRGPGLGLALSGLLREAGPAWREEQGSLCLGRTPPTGRPADAPAAVQRERPELETEADGGAGRPMDWLPRLKIFRGLPGELEFGARRRGSFVHACLEQLAEAVRRAAKRPDELEAEELIARAVRRAEQLFPLPPPAGLPLEATAMLAWFVKLPGALDWLRDGVSEQPLLDASGAEYRPDLMTPEEAGWLVIEYKTGLPEPGHAAQLGRYLGLLGRIAGLPARGLLIYLDARSVRAVEAQA